MVFCKKVIWTQTAYAGARCSYLQVFNVIFDCVWKDIYNHGGWLCCPFCSLLNEAYGVGTGGLSQCVVFNCMY